MRLIHWILCLISDNCPIPMLLILLGLCILAFYIQINREKLAKRGNLVYDKEGGYVGVVDGLMDIDGFVRLTNNRGMFWYVDIRKLRKLTPKERFDYYVQSL
jgi:hypothetical protein